MKLRPGNGTITKQMTSQFYNQLPGVTGPVSILAAKTRIILKEKLK